MREFARGVALLGRGFAYWPRRPGLMALGLLPAAIVGALFLSGLIALGAFLPGITDAVTPFADGWPGMWATVIRAAVGTALLGGALVLVAISFTALTLLIGEPFYDRIWKAVETDAGRRRHRRRLRVLAIAVGRARALRARPRGRAALRADQP